MTPEDIEIARSRRARTTLAAVVVGVASVGIVALAVTMVVSDTDNAQMVFNVLVPVVASWVGTILAFYFGRENFESANREIREMVKEISPDQQARQPVTAIMHPAWSMVARVLDDSGGDDSPDDGVSTLDNVTVATIDGCFVGKVTRLPILRPDRSPLMMIHQSRLNQYLADGGSPDDTLATFVARRAAEIPPVRFDYGYGFVTVPDTATVADVKFAFDHRPAVQDVFVTHGGTSDGVVLGWVSNIRLARYLPV